MLIESIKVENWRSFHGENEFILSVEPDRNVTLIRAENGVGKTSLLAAVNWCLFGDLPDESLFEFPEKIVNEHAIEHDGAVKAIVTIVFSHGEKSYRARRSYIQNKTSSGLDISRISEGGELPLGPQNHDMFINSVIPREMAPHFFFYGESTSRYAGTTGARQFGEAVKGILGSTVANMALKGIKKVRQEYNKQAADNSGEEARNIEQDIEDINQNIECSEKDVLKLENEIQAAKNRIDDLNEELANIKPAKEAQNRRTSLEKKLKGKESQKEKAEQISGEWMQKYITSILADSLISAASEVIQKEDMRGKLPSPYDEKFVNDLLEDGKCICGARVSEGSIEYENIRSLLSTAGNQTVMSRIISTKAALVGLEKKSQYAWNEFHRNKDDLKNLDNDIQTIDSEIEEVSKTLLENPISNIGEKEKKREAIKEQCRDAEKRKISKLASIMDLENIRREKERQRNALVEKSDKARRYVKRSKFAEALANRLESRLSDEEKKAREEIEEEINVIVRKSMRKTARVEISQDYELRLLDESGEEIPKSTGENQLLGLAFTGAVARYAKNRKDIIKDIFLPGTIAPLVVDSPFGHLDPVSRGSVAKFLPELASQVILLVSTSQASDAVMTPLEEKIGKEYLLTRHNQGSGEGKQPERIEIRGKTYELTTYNSEINGTRITEVR